MRPSGAEKNSSAGKSLAYMYASRISLSVQVGTYVGICRYSDDGQSRRVGFAMRVERNKPALLFIQDAAAQCYPYLAPSL